MIDFNKKISEFGAAVNEFLKNNLPKGSITADSMRYSIFAGGKRIRPAICLAFCELFSRDHFERNMQKALPFAAALESIHTYSLMYDDLPCMDNDTLRRGMPTNHVRFGEDITLMAGVALYGEAFGFIVSSPLLSDSEKLEGIRVLLDASGIKGIVTGQVLDIENKQDLTEEELRNIQNLKTGAMLKASALLGCIAANATEKEREKAVAYAENIGLAFQMRDDILDVQGDVNSLGKSIGKDKESKKVTFVDVLGIEKTQKEIERLTKKAKDAVSDAENCEFLIMLADALSKRNH